MSGFEAALIPLAIGAAGQTLNVYQQHQNNQSQRKAQQAAADAQNQAIERQNQIIAVQQRQEQKRQANLLAQQQAAARAQMGAWGAGGTGGSADAILQGMAQRTAESMSEDAEMARLRLRPVRQSLLASDDSEASATVGAGLNIFKSFYDAR